MRKSFKGIFAAGLLGLCITSASLSAVSPALASENVLLTVSTTSNPAGTAGTWSVYEQNSDPTLTSGLAGIQFNLQASGGVTLTSSSVQLPTGMDVNSDSKNGFFLFRSKGTAVPNTTTPGNEFKAITGAQPGAIYINSAGDVQTIFPGFGNKASTVPFSDDGSGDDGTGDAPGVISYLSFGLPGLVAQGGWIQDGSGGTIAAIGAANATILLPQTLPTPTPDGANVGGFSPAAVLPGSVTIAALPEPALSGMLLVGSMLILGSRHRATKI